jgi:hypothetical protein
MVDATPQRPRRRVPPTLPILLLGAAAGAVLLYLARSMTFWQDEWGVILFRGSGLDVLRPINEHWSTIPLLLYRATFGLVGLHSYLPYVAQVIALHLVAVAAVFVLARHRNGPLIATLACLPLLLLGSGSENLFWAYQTGFVGSVAFGLWALVLLDRSGRRATVGAAILLLAAVMSSGMGLGFLVAAFGRTILDPAARSRAVALLLPGAAYAVWYLTLGKASVAGVDRLAGPVELSLFVARGIGHAVGATTGLGTLPRGDALGVVLFAVVAIGTGWAIVKWRPPLALAAGALLAIAAMYTLIGLVRAELASDFATRSRYVYVAAFLIALVVVDWLPILRDRVGGRTRRRTALIAVLSVALVAAVAANLAAFGPIRTRFAFQSELTRAYIALAVAHPGASWIDPASVLPGMPALPDVVDAVGRYGSPVRDDLLPGLVRAPGREAREAALLRMVRSAFRAGPATTGADLVTPPVSGVDDATVRWDGACLTATAVRTRGRLTVLVPTGSGLQITAARDGTAVARLGREPPPSHAIPVELQGGVPIAIAVPDMGDETVWSVGLELPAGLGPVEVCGAVGP